MFRLNAFFYGNQHNKENREVIEWNRRNRVDFVSFCLIFHVSKSLEEQRKRVIEFIEMMGRESGDVRYDITYLLLFYDSLAWNWKEKQEKRKLRESLRSC